MSTFPLRNLGAIGVIPDANSYDLPPNALSDCNNVIFNEGRVQRAPIFKNLFNAIRSSLAYDASIGSYDSQANTYESAEGDPADAVRFVGSFQDPGTGEVVFVCDNDGVVRAYPNGILSFVTPVGTLVTNNEPWTHAQVGGISFLARKAMHPYARNIVSDTLYTLANGDWPVGDSAAVARPFLDFIILLNVTKSGVEYPTMVKWCNPIQYGSPITSINWDATNTNYIAGENVLAEIKTPLRDGGVLGNAFVLYAQDQVWSMEFTGSANVFNFRRLFPTGGIINTNCWAEVEGKHFVFGENDIYVHDGNSKRSIADKRVRKKIFGTLNREKQKSFYVLHDSVSNLIHFCYQTSVDEVGFSNTMFCNKSAIYNYNDDTWSFMDLPNTVGGAEANITLASSIYADMNVTYSLFNTNYVSFEGSTDKMSIMLGVTDPANSLSESRIYAIDLPSNGIINLPIEEETLKPAFFERVGVDLDEGGAAIRNYKLITSFLPQANVGSSSDYLRLYLGASDLPNAAIDWKAVKDFYPEVDYKMDAMVAGRYLGYRVEFFGPENFNMSGFDTELKELSRR